MPKNFFKLSISKDSVRASILLFNGLVWFFMTLTMIRNIIDVHKISSEQTFLVWTIYYFALTAASLIGAFLSTKISRMKLIQFWIILGIMTAPIAILLTNFTTELFFIACGFWGISFGFGMPSCLAYFADSTLVEKRGRAGGIIMLITNFTAPLFSILFMSSNLMVNTIVFTLWRAIVLLAFVAGSTKVDAIENKKNSKVRSIIIDKSFILYFVAWLMFCFIDRFEMPTLADHMADINSIIVIMGPIIGGISAVVAGLVSDQIGRKRVVIFGFATFGIAYAILGLAPDWIVSKYFYATIDGISTGILWVIFLLIIWGDLSKHNASEKYYAIGVIPFFLTTLVSQYIISLDKPLFGVISAFSLASVFLFLAVLPLLYAPETLPEKKIELIRLRKFADEAKKAKEKYETKKD